MKLELTLNYLVATTEPNQSWRAAYLAAGNVELDSITKNLLDLSERMETGPHGSASRVKYEIFT